MLQLAAALVFAAIIAVMMGLGYAASILAEVALVLFVIYLITRVSKFRPIHGKFRVARVRKER